MRRNGRHRSPTSDRARRPWLTALVAALLVAPLATLVAFPSANASVLSGSPVAVAGVDAFGIGAGQLASPGGLSADSKGDVFVVDQSNSRVQEYVVNAGATAYAKAGVTVAGTGGHGAGATQLALSVGQYPSAVALDQSGDLFVADSGNNRVQEYLVNPTSGSYASAARTVAGAGGLGSGPTQLNNPNGVALDAKGDLFVADTANSRVQEYVFNAATGAYASTGTVVAGIGGVGSALNQLNNPDAVAFGSNGDLFVIDALNFRALEYAYNSTTSTYATTATLVANISAFPQSLTFDANGNLFVSYSYLGYGAVLEFAYNA